MTVRGVADPLDFGPLFALVERDAPNVSPSRLAFPGPQEDVAGRRERRLGEQLGTIFRVIRDGEWRTLEEIAERTGYATPSISAQLRHLRKPHWGSYVIARRHRGRGVYEYRLELDEDGRPMRSESQVAGRRV